MISILNTSWKNVWRSKLRSTIVMVAVMIGLFGGIFASAVMKGAAEQRVKSAIKNEVSHIQIHQAHFLDNTEMSLTLKGTEDKLAKIRALPEVEAAAARLKITAMAQTAQTGTGLTLIGVHPGEEKQITNIYQEIPDSMGQYLTQEDRRVPSVVIGKKLADKLKARVRSKIVFTFQEADGTLTGGAFRVTGIFDVTNSAFEQTTAFVRFADLQKLIQLPPNESHEIAVLLNDKDATQAALGSLKSQFPELDILPWQKIQPDIGLVTEFMDIMLFMVMIIILLALSFGIINTMLMVVLERTKEIGMLMAIGMGKAKVFLMIMYETIMLSFVGGLVGMGISAAVVNYYNTHGLDLTAFAEGFEALGYEPMIYPTIGTGFYFAVGLLIILTAILSSIYPALKALKLKPAEAIRMDN